MAIHLTTILTAILILGGFISSWSMEKLQNEKMDEESISKLFIPIPPPPPQVRPHIPIRHHFRTKQLPINRVFMKRQGRGYESYDPWDGGMSDYGSHHKSELYYILPVLLVIGLGATLVPLISTFFTAMISSNSGCCSRTVRTDAFDKVKPFLGSKVMELWDKVEGSLFKYDETKNSDKVRKTPL